VGLGARPGQFYQALIDSLKARLFPESERSVCDAVSAVLPSIWPDKQPPEYAEQSLKMLCTVFRVPYNAQSKTAYRDFKDSKGLAVTGPMQRFINSVESLPVSTAECERGFSRMNIICTELRSSLSISHMSSLMFIGLVGPPVALFKPLSYVKSWLAYMAGETLNLRQAHAEK